MNEYLAAPFARFAESALDADFPDLARRRAVDAITDCVGCQLAGGQEALAAILTKAFPWSEEARDGMPAYLVGHGGYANAADAAWYGGAIAHALDYDDTNHPAYAHPSAAIWPAILAASSLVEVSGRDLVSAYIAGFELIGKLGRVLNTAHYSHGWHATGTFGSLAAALAAAALMRLSSEKVETSLAIAASSASGIRANFGTMTKPLHAGQAARAGVISALLAREGFTAARDALEHRFGYLSVFDGGGQPEVRFMAEPGCELEILTNYGLALKPYPACGATHPGIEAAILLHDDLAGRVIRSVRVGVSEFSFKPLIHSSPQSPLECKFSLEFCVAAALTEGRVLLDTFTDPMVSDQTIRQLMQRIEVVVDERVRTSPEFSTIISVIAEDGFECERSIPLAKGKPERWFSEDDIRVKFLDCTGRAGIAERKASALLDDLRALDADLPAEAIVAQLSSAAPSREAPAKN